MNQSKMDRTEDSLTSIARKVLDAVPLQESWATAEVIAEMRRKGQNPDFRVVAGCLASLCEQRLVREPVQGKFTRVQSKPVLKAVKEVKAETPVAVATETRNTPETTGTTKPDTLGKIAALSNGLRTLSDALANAAKQLDDVAIEVEERIQSIEADGQQLQQLRMLLKNIGLGG